MFPALAVHCSASISLSFFVFEKWECWTYWVIFALCRFVFLHVKIHFNSKKYKTCSIFVLLILLHQII